MSVTFQKVRCRFRRQGKRCEAWAQHDEDYCWAHNPDGRARAQIARTKRMNREGRLR